MDCSRSLLRRFSVLAVLLPATCAVMLSYTPAHAQPALTAQVKDLDGNGIVGVTDLLILLAAWDTYTAGPPDFDGGGVGVTDMLEL